METKNYNRKERRSALKNVGILRQVSKMNYRERFSLQEMNLQKGKELHGKNVEKFQNNLASKIEYLEKLEMTKLSNMDLSQEEINERMDKWVESIMWPKAKPSKDVETPKMLIPGVPQEEISLFPNEDSI